MALQTDDVHDELHRLTSTYLDDVGTCIDTLAVAVVAYGSDPEQFWHALQRIEDAESDCDEHLAAVRTLVGRSMGPSFSHVYFRPAAVIELFDRIDEVVNAAEAFLTDLGAMAPPLAADTQRDLLRMSRYLADAVDRLATATRALLALLCGERPECDLHEAATAISRLESRCDTLRDKLTADAFASRGREAGLVARALARGLDDAVDAAEDAADHLVYVETATLPTDSRSGPSSAGMDGLRQQRR